MVMVRYPQARVLAKTLKGISEDVEMEKEKSQELLLFNSDLKSPVFLELEKIKVLTNILILKFKNSLDAKGFVAPWRH